MVADHRLSAVGGVPQPTRRARCRVSEPGAAAAAPDSTFPSRQRSAAGRMRYAKQIVKDFGGRSQAAIRN